VRLLDEAWDFTRSVAASGRPVLFVGTKKQAQETIQTEAARCGMYFVNRRWMGGMLTNFSTVKKRIERLQELRKMQQEGQFETMSKKEAKRLTDELDRLMFHFDGIADMKRLPGALYVVDPRKEHIAVTEANRLKIPVVAITDSNCDPDLITYVIPGNDDAIRAVKLLTAKIADACQEGRQEAQARGAHVIAVATDGNEDIQHHADDVIYVPRSPAFLQAVLAVVPLQLLAYRIARLRGLNVDQPRNLAKTVTVE